MMLVRRGLRTCTYEKKGESMLHLKHAVYIRISVKSLFSQILNPNSDFKLNTAHLPVSAVSIL